MYIDFLLYLLVRAFILFSSQKNQESCTIDLGISLTKGKGNSYFDKSISFGMLHHAILILHRRGKYVYIRSTDFRHSLINDLIISDSFIPMDFIDSVNG